MLEEPVNHSMTSGMLAANQGPPGSAALRMRSTGLSQDVDCIEDRTAKVEKLEQGVAEFLAYIQNNRAHIPNYGERHRHDETISTGFVESTVNQVVSKRFAKKQQMQWTPRGAHLLLQTRTKVLNEDLEETFRGWYPAFRHDAEGLAA